MSVLNTSSSLVNPAIINRKNDRQLTRNRKSDQPSVSQWAVKFLLFAWIFMTVCLSQTYAQTTYYVSAAGNDANNGRSALTPFQSLSKVNTLSLQAGDSVLFRRGDTFRGGLQIRRSGSTARPIVFNAYGTGAKPTLAGSVPITNWVNISGNIWQAPCSSCGSRVTGIYRNDSALPLGRYPNFDAPNRGYMTIRAHTEKYQIFSQEHLPDNIDWQGGEVAMRPTQWIIDRAVIDHQYGDALNLFNYSNYYPGDGWGYFIQSHPATLDQNGEWYYNPNNKTVQLYSSTSPNSQTITATVTEKGVDMANLSNVNLRNLRITQTLSTGVAVSNSSSFSLVNLDITNSGEDGLVVLGTGSNMLLENSTVIDVNNNGIFIDPYQNVTLRGNKIRRIGVIPGRGKSGDGQYNGVAVAANQNVLIENNIVDSVGYNGITFWNNTTIRQNVISNYCITKSDGGAVYAWNGNKTAMMNMHIVSNIMYNGIGAPEGSFRREYSGANGIFLDDCLQNVEIKNNTVFNNHQWGIYLHGTSSINMTGNTSYNNGQCQFIMYHDAGYCRFRDNIVKRNVFVSKQASQLVGQYESDINDLKLYGAIDSNYYARPFDETATIRGIINNSQGGNYELRDWKTFSQQDSASKSSPVTYNQYRNNGAGGVNRINSTFDRDNDGWAVIYSNYGNAEAARDEAKLDRGSLRVSFPTPSGQPNSYAQVTKSFGAITKDKTYLLRFDAVSTAAKTILVYIRDYGPPYREYDRRYSIALSPDRKSYEIPFTAQDDQANTILMFQVDGEGTTFWLDNIRLQEGIANRNNPDDFIKLIYNPTLKDSLVTVSGRFRDVKNQRYTNQILLKPFTSIVLFKDTIPQSPVDLSVALQTDKRVLQVDEPTVFRFRVSNQSDSVAGSTQWTCRLPANMQFLDSGQVYDDNVRNGMVAQLPAHSDTTFAFRVKATASGTYRVAVQLTSSASPDTDSTPDSGTADGEDDAAMVDLRVGNTTPDVFDSPNPLQKDLPAVASNQPRPNPAQADLSMSMSLSSQSPMLNDTINCVLSVRNAGGAIAGNVQVQSLLPSGLQFISGAGWTASGSQLTAIITNLSPDTTVQLTFKARVVTTGHWTSQAQIMSSDKTDPDSTPGNGFTNGEDDRAQADFRIR